MIKQLIKALKENVRVTDWLINEVETESSQAFYVLQKLETTRVVKTLEYTVTVYHRFTENGQEYLGSSSFALSHKLAKPELAKKIEEAVFAATLIKNKAYQLVKGIQKRVWREKPYDLSPFEALDQIAKTFFSVSKPEVRFNSLEVFLSQTTNHIVNSLGVDLKNTLYKIDVEAIPSYDGKDQKVELYKFYHYKDLNFELILSDAKHALEDVTTRYLAKPIAMTGKLDVLLKDQDVAEFFDNLLSDYAYDSIYKGYTDKVIGDMVQKTIEEDALTVGYTTSSKAVAFDKDGVLLKPLTIIEQGKLVQYYGSNQYANYLNIDPSGLLDTIQVAKGKTPVSRLKAKPHLEIIALSGIQIDMYRGYIGGEVRLAVYFDGKQYFPVSGFSFSGNIDQCLTSIKLSKETVKLSSYVGPKVIKLTNMEII